MNNTYAKTIVDILLDYLQDETKGLPQGYFQAFFYGDPMDIPSSLLPCVMVEKASTNIKAGPLGMDEVDPTVNIKLAYNKKNDFGATTSEVLGTRKLEEFAEAIDLTTGEYSPNSVMGIIRKYFTLANPDGSYNVLDQTISIRYGVVSRPKGNWTAECQISCKFHYLKKVSERS